MVLRINSTFLTPKGPFSLVSFIPAFRVDSMTAQIFRVRSVALLAANPISPTYLAYWWMLTTESKYSRMKVGKAETDLLRPLAILLMTKTLPAKMKASISNDGCSAICEQKYARGILICRRFCCLLGVVLRLTKCSMGDFFSVLISNQTAEFP